MVILCLVSLTLWAQQTPNASGTLTVNGVTSTLQHGYAFHDAGNSATRVLVTAKPVTAAHLGEGVGLGS